MEKKKRLLPTVAKSLCLIVRYNFKNSYRNLKSGKIILQEVFPIMMA